MGNHTPTLPAWLNRLLSSKPAPLPHIVIQPRCTCGRYCAHEKPDMTSKLVADMTAAGLYVPARFRDRQEGRG